MKQITAFARRWEDFYGNTYHTVIIFYGTEQLIYTDQHYGYGDRYKQTTYDCLSKIDFSFDPSDILFICQDVTRKKDL